MSNNFDNVLQCILGVSGFKIDVFAQNCFVWLHLYLRIVISH